MTVAELRAIAKEIGVKRIGTMNKADLEIAIAQMSFDNFVMIVKEKIAKCFEVGFVKEVQITKVNKNNVEYTGLNIVSHESNISPNIYLNGFYSEFVGGMKLLDEILREIANIRMKYDGEPDVNINEITDFEKAKGKIIPRIFSYNNMADNPHKEFLDMIITFAVVLSNDTNGQMAVNVTNDLMKTWNTTLDELYDIAMENLASKEYSFKSMNEVMTEMMLPQMLEEFDGDEEAAREAISEMMPPEENMFVLTNEEKLNGAVLIADNDVLRAIREKLGKDFYVLPSSIHELLIVPIDSGVNASELISMVWDVNDTQVAPEDRLTYSVYIYHNGELSII